MSRALVVVLMTVVAGGCGEGPPDASRPDSSRQLGDTTFVFSSSPLRGTASLREVSRIGMIDGPPEYLLGAVPMFTVGPDGSLFIADANDGLPEYHPPVRQVVAGTDETIWLLREMREDRVDVWEIYDSDGTLEGTVEVGHGRSSLSSSRYCPREP